MTKLILIRHGLSAWNEQNLFTGWVDIPLSAKGIEESIQAGKKISNEPIDRIYTSTLIRAQMTLVYVMLENRSQKIPLFLHPNEGRMEEWGRIYGKEAKQKTIPVTSAWQLNERMYGELQGLNKKETAERYGADKVHTWRRSFGVAPPNGESLEMTAARAVPYFQKEILPRLKTENILICAHGNSLRAIIMFLDRLTPEEVVKLELPTGEPVLYTERVSKNDHLANESESIWVRQTKHHEELI